MYLKNSFQNPNALKNINKMFRRYKHLMFLFIIFLYQQFFSTLCSTFHDIFPPYPLCLGNHYGKVYVLVFNSLLFTHIFKLICEKDNVRIEEVDLPA